MKFPKPKGGMMKGLQNNLLDITYSVYVYGRDEQKKKERCLTFQEFARRVKQIHEAGNKIRLKRSEKDG